MEESKNTTRTKSTSKSRQWNWWLGEVDQCIQEGERTDSFAGTRFNFWSLVSLRQTSQLPNVRCTTINRCKMRSSMNTVSSSGEAAVIWGREKKREIASLLINWTVLCAVRQVSGPLSAVSVIKPSTRRAPCRSTWSNTLERSPSSVRCAASGSLRRATWSTTWRDPTATVSSPVTSHQQTH